MTQPRGASGARGRAASLGALTALTLMVCLSACRDDSVPESEPEPEIEIDPQCEDLCVTQRDCAAIPLDNCEAECSMIVAAARRATEEGYAGCEDAARMALECQEQLSCDEWARGLALDGPCAATIMVQDSACQYWPFFPNWDVCIAYCDNAVSQCATSHYIDWKDCWGQCKLNSTFDAVAECGDESYALRVCLAGFESCTEFTTFYEDDPNNECRELSDQWEQTCVF